MIELCERLLRDFEAAVMASPLASFATILAGERRTSRSLIQDVGASID